NARTLFAIQDANGDYRPLFLQASCATLAQIVNSIPGAESLLNLTPILTNLGLCPKQAAADIAAFKHYQSNLASKQALAAGQGKSANATTTPTFQPKLPVQ